MIGLVSGWKNTARKWTRCGRAEPVSNIFDLDFDLEKSIRAAKISARAPLDAFARLIPRAAPRLARPAEGHVISHLR